MTYDLESAISGAKQARKYMKDHGIKGRTWTSAVVVDRALDRGITVQADARNRARLSDGQKSYWFSVAHTNYNTRLARRTAHHKEVTSSLLRSHNILSPQNATFETNESSRAWEWAEPILPIVLKPSSALGGKMVYVGITDQSEFNSAFVTIAERYGRVLVEQYVEGIEHRVLLVNGRYIAATRRVPAYVIGDGTLSIDTLVEHRTNDRLASANPIHRHVTLDDQSIRELKRQGYRSDSIPPKGVTVYLRSTSNIHTGGDAVDATDDLSPAEIEYSERAGRSIPGLRLAGFDILLPRHGVGSAPCIIEVNANPMLPLHHFPIKGEVRDAAGALVDAMFPNV